MIPPKTSEGAGKSGVPRRRRDRHGRGLRGPLAPSQVPVGRSRSDRFDELVLDAVERLEKRFAKEIAEVEFMVDDVPPEPVEGQVGDPVVLGRAEPAEGDLPPRVIVYRRPIEARTSGQRDLAALVHEVVVEQVAELLGLAPHQVDPRYEGDEDE